MKSYRCHFYKLRAFEKHWVSLLARAFSPFCEHSLSLSLSFSFTSSLAHELAHTLTHIYAADTYHFKACVFKNRVGGARGGGGGGRAAGLRRGVVGGGGSEGTPSPFFCWPVDFWRVRKGERKLESRNSPSSLSLFLSLSLSLPHTLPFFNARMRWQSSLYMRLPFYYISRFLNWKSTSTATATMAAATTATLTTLSTTTHCVVTNPLLMRPRRNFLVMKGTLRSENITFWVYDELMFRVKCQQRSLFYFSPEMISKGS